MSSLYHEKQDVSIFGLKIRSMPTQRKRRGRPALPEEKRGVQIRHRVLPSTRIALAEIAAITGETVGEVLDRLVATECRWRTAVSSKKRT